MPQSFQGFDVLFKNQFRFRESIHRPLHAVFPQKVQGGIGRTVGEIRDIVHLCSGKLKLRMKTGDLDDAVQPQVRHQLLGLIQQVIEIKKVLKAARSH